MTEAAIRPADPREPGATALLRASNALMRALFPAEDCTDHDIGALCAPDLRLFLAEAEGTAQGSVALALREGYGEIKCFYVVPSRRGTGLGRRLLSHVEAEARAVGLTLLRLETGTELTQALRFYERAGYAYCGPYGGNRVPATSLYMEKAL